jgi:hypothetical protein
MLGRAVSQVDTEGPSSDGVSPCLLALPPKILFGMTLEGEAKRKPRLRRSFALPAPRLHPFSLAVLNSVARSSNY